MEVELKNVSFGYEQRLKSNGRTHKIILDDISFSVKASSSVSIVGASGCGKSTLLRLICGLLPRNIKQYFSGQIFLDSHEINNSKKIWEELHSKGKIGFMFQENSLLPNLNVKDNIELPLRIIENSKLLDDNYIADLLTTIGLTNYENEMPSRLSGGQVARTALARTFSTKPSLLLLDEPFASLDIDWKSTLYEKIKSLKEKNNTTIILVTHDIFEAITMAEEIIILGKDHKIIEIIRIENWTQDLTYYEVVKNFQKDVLHIWNHIRELE